MDYYAHIPKTKAELLAGMERSFGDLNTLVDSLTGAQMTTLTDAAGWTVADHLTHLAAWEMSVVFFLRGRNAWEGMGIDEALYRAWIDSADEINAAIRQRHKGQSLADALAEFRGTHQQLLDLLQPMTDADLLRVYRRWGANEPDRGEGDGPTMMRWINSDATPHFIEHLEYIKALVKGPSPA